MEKKIKDIIWKKDKDPELSAERHEGYIGRKFIGSIVLFPNYECSAQTYRAFLHIDDNDKMPIVEHKTLPGIKKLVDKKLLECARIK